MTKDKFTQLIQDIWIQGGPLIDKRIRTLNLLNEYEALTKQKLNKLPVMRPASESAVGGELLPAEGSAKHVSDGLCHCVNHTDCDCIYENKCSECGLPLRA